MPTCPVGTLHRTTLPSRGSVAPPSAHPVGSSSGHFHHCFSVALGSGLVLGRGTFFFPSLQILPAPRQPSLLLLPQLSCLPTTAYSTSVLKLQTTIIAPRQLGKEALTAFCGRAPFQCQNLFTSDRELRFSQINTHTIRSDNVHDYNIATSSDFIPDSPRFGKPLLSTNSIWSRPSARAYLASNRAFYTHPALGTCHPKLERFIVPLLDKSIRTEIFHTAIARILTLFLGQNGSHTHYQPYLQPSFPDRHARLLPPVLLPAAQSLFSACHEHRHPFIACRPGHRPSAHDSHPPQKVAYAACYHEDAPH